MSTSVATPPTNPSTTLDSETSSGAIAPSKGPRIDGATLALFTVAIFSSACLLFVVQPMVGKILLPKLGGAPAVWNTCMVFFQATLLAGYLTAHLLTKYVPLRGQVAIFAAALFAAFWSLPIGVGPDWVDQLLAGRDPNVWLLSVLFCRVAPVFFVLSITSPLMQKWFARSGHKQGSDPYFLYAASNIGSILALLAYPFVIEVQLGVAAQTSYWMYGFAFFAALAAVCGMASVYGSNRLTSSPKSGVETEVKNESGLEERSMTWARRMYWVLLSFVPSSLMLGVTTYVSTDVSSIPLIWVIPLTLYLLTFVFAFSSRQIFSAYWMGRIASLLITVIMVTVVTGANHPPIVIIPMHLLMFFAVAMFCHQRLANDRPPAEHLTDFYLWLSVGGVLGGLFNALLAPSLFVTIIEYPMVMVLASYLRETREEDKPFSQAEALKLLGFGALIFGLVFVLIKLTAGLDESSLGQMSLPLHISQIRTLIVFGLPAAFVMHQMERRRFFTLGLAAILMLSLWHDPHENTTLAHDRNFYGTVSSAEETLDGGQVVKMFHGNTIHGWQWTDEARRGIPLTYYGKSSGVGKMIAARHAASEEPLRVGAIGLGAGTMAAALEPGDWMRYYEINPQVVDHARKYFTYLDDAESRGVKMETRLGDARLVLEAEFRESGSHEYDLLIVDAFSSDSIPAHLITHECFQTYMSHVKPDGVIAVHITNRYLNLEPVLAAMAEANDLVAYGYNFYDPTTSSAFNEETGETTSSWVLLTRDDAAIAALKSEKDMKALVAEPGHRLWTDDYSNVMGAFESR